MTTSTIHGRLLFIASALAFSPNTLYAGNIAIETGEGNVAAFMEREANTFTDALGRALVDLNASPPPGKAFAWLRGKVQGATLARIEYTYERNGRKITRVYHGHSGHSLQTIIEKISKKEPPGSSGGESTPGDSGEPAEVAEADDVARDAAEAIYYPADTDVDIRAPKLPEDTSQLEATIVDDMNHSWDAELKTLRRIEWDIDRNIVPKGGRVTGYVSKTVCESCRQVIDRFAEIYDAEGTIYQLVEPGAGPLPAVPSTSIERSMAASRKLLDSRKAYARANLSPAADKVLRQRDRSTLLDVDRLEEEEIAIDSAPHGACVE